MKTTARLAWIGALAFLLCVPVGCRDNSRSAPGTNPGAMLVGETRMGLWRCSRYADPRVVRVGETVQRNGEALR